MDEMKQKARELLAAELDEAHLVARVLEATADTGVFVTPKQAIRAIVAALSASRPVPDEGEMERVREHLRLTMLEQKTTGLRETYTDGFAQGLCYAIQQIDARAALSALPGEEWQDIASAPRDGTEILVCVTHNLPDGGWETVQWVDWAREPICWPRYLDRIDIPFPPTHWRHLPAAPNEGGEE